LWCLIAQVFWWVYPQKPVYPKTCWVFWGIWVSDHRLNVTVCNGVPVWHVVADKQSYALSVRDYNQMTHEVTIKHYRIRKLDRGGVYISPKKSFSDLLQLVEHYSSKYIMNMCDCCSCDVHLWLLVLNVNLFVNF